jgi:regulator of sigma E protease
LDPNPNAGNPEPVNSSVPPPPTGNPPPGATAGGAEDHPDHRAEVFALKTWLRENMFSLLFTAISIALICIYTDPIDTLKVIIGLGLVIFIHELGHFLAAKWCDVHVKTFSIGFGPAVPFCSYKWGETTYMVGIIPLGGYVSMVGEGDNAGDEEAEEDPRSFRHKSVGQRMVIISAGVIMNIFLGLACFAAAYLHGVREEPAIAGSIVSGGAAWRAGMVSGDQITKIGSRDHPTFRDLRPIVMSTRKGDEVKVWIERDGKVLVNPLDIEPLREEGTYFPTLGIQAQPQLQLFPRRKNGPRHVLPGTPAAKANPPFEPGDRIVAMTDPDPTKNEPTELKSDINEYYRRMEVLADKPITFRLARVGPDGKQVEIVVPPAYRANLGVRMRIGKVVALRKDGPAAKAGVQVVPEDNPSQGDLIKTLKLPEANGKETWFTTADTAEATPVPGIDVRKLDPIRLPIELKKWADRNPGNRTVKLVVLRQEGHQDRKPVELTLQYDPNYRYDREVLMLPNSPVPLGGLGLAYLVEAIVDEVDPNGPAKELRPGDVITAVRFKVPDDAGNKKTGNWQEIKVTQWAAAEFEFQRWPFELDLKVQRSVKNGEVMEQKTVEVLDIVSQDDKTWPTADRGLGLQQDFRVQTATDFGDALALGWWRTVRFIKEVYMNLYGMIFGRISARTMSGPLSIGNVAYKLAGEDFWQFLLFLGMISVNLAVVNFLPIPVLDGGHMVFLLLEKILGRPVPERVFNIAMIIGLFLILCLMIAVFTLDINRLFF